MPARVRRISATREARSTKAFLFSDLRDYTSFVETNGDAAAARLLREYRTLVRREVARYEGAEVKTEGDSFYVVFVSPSSAIECAVSIVRAAESHTASRPESPLRVGIGVHAGEAVEYDDQFVGSAVNVASRLAGKAGAMEVVVSDTVITPPDEDGDNQTIALNRPASFFYSELVQSDRHSLIINYSWDLPRMRANNPLARLLVNGWQISGENAFVSGDWAPVVFTTADSFDFTGGEGGNGACLTGNDTSAPPCLRIVRPVLVGEPTIDNPDPLTGWFNTAAFKRPARGDYGNTPRNVIQKPGVFNWNLAVFKNFEAGAQRSLQLRCEVYNVLNAVEFQDIDRTARFDAAGNQINPNFGTAIGIANPTRPPRVIQLSARFSF